VAVRQLSLRIVQAEISGTATEVAGVRALHAHYRCREITRQLGGGPEDARRVVAEIAACRAEFTIADESS
jgi:hypothetical protein